MTHPCPEHELPCQSDCGCDCDLDQKECDPCYYDDDEPSGGYDE
jgi:hypothetical protein